MKKSSLVSVVIYAGAAVSVLVPNLYAVIGDCPEKMPGPDASSAVAPRFSALSATAALNADNLFPALRKTGLPAEGGVECG